MRGMTYIEVGFNSLQEERKGGIRTLEDIIVIKMRDNGALKPASGCEKGAKFWMYFKVRHQDLITNQKWKVRERKKVKEGTKILVLNA